MFLAAGVGGYHVGAILFSIVSIIVMIVLIILIVRLIFRGNSNRNKDLTRIEEKLDILLKRKDKL